MQCSSLPCQKETYVATISVYKIHIGTSRQKLCRMTRFGDHLDLRMRNVKLRCGKKRGRPFLKPKDHQSMTLNLSACKKRHLSLCLSRLPEPAHALCRSNDTWSTLPKPTCPPLSRCSIRMLLFDTPHPSSCPSLQGWT